MNNTDNKNIDNINNLDKYISMGINNYRTDTQGQITVISDGNTINITTEK